MIGFRTAALAPFAIALMASGRGIARCRTTAKQERMKGCSAHDVHKFSWLPAYLGFRCVTVALRVQVLIYSYEVLYLASLDPEG